MKTRKIMVFMLIMSIIASALFMGGNDFSAVQLYGSVYSFSDGNFVYKFLNGNALSVEEYIGDQSDDADMIIPSSVLGYEVKRINGLNKTFNELNMNKVTIPDSVDRIDKYAFEDITTDILVIGKRVSNIDFIYDLTVEERIISRGKRFVSVDNILYNSDKSKLLYCPKSKPLNNYTLPDSVKTIEKYAFSACGELRSIRMNGIEKIKDNAFSYSSIQTAVLPKTLNYLGKEVFAACENLKKVTINTTTKCNAYAGSGMLSSTDTLTIGKNVSNEKIVRYFTVYKKYVSHSKYFNVMNNILYNKDKTRLLNCPRSNTLKNYKLPDSVISIEEYAFSFCKNVKSVDLNNVKTIKKGAFCYSGITKSVIRSKVEYIGQDAFSDCYKLSRLKISANKKLKIASGAFACTAPDSVYIPCDVGSWAFCECTKLTKVTFSNDVKKISDKAFYGCYGLKTVTVPASVKKIGKYAFGYYIDDWDGSICKVKGFTIKGAKNSAAEKYAKNNGFTFKSVKG